MNMSYFHLFLYSCANCECKKTYCSYSSEDTEDKTVELLFKALILESSMGPTYFFGSGQSASQRVM